jgi:hypothetical protein
MCMRKNALSINPLRISHKRECHFLSLVGRTIFRVRDSPIDQG